MCYVQKPAFFSKWKIFIIEFPSPKEKASKLKVKGNLAFSQAYKATLTGTMKATLFSQTRGQRINERLARANGSKMVQGTMAVS